MLANIFNFAFRPEPNDVYHSMQHYPQRFGPDDVPVRMRARACDRKSHGLCLEQASRGMG